MKPILYKPTETKFIDNGIGILSDAAFCEVTEERNGVFELVLDYPINGIHFDEIEHRSIIFAKPNPTANPQPFRVYNISKPLGGMVTINAAHISYDLTGIVVEPFEAGSAAAALQELKNNSVTDNPFEFWTDKSTTATMKTAVPASVRALLGGVQGSVLDTYGGEYEWDGYTVKLYNKRGENRGVSIRYGKNLIDLKQEENCANVYTAVMPFWADTEGNYIALDEKIIEVEGTFDFVKVMPLDLSAEFENQPTKEELKNRTYSYIKNNKIGVPKITLSLSFVQLEQTEEYKNKALLERVNLCDSVNVVFEKLGISATAKVIKTVYNVLLDRYENVELGDARSNLADTIVKQENDIKEAPKKAMSMAAQAAANATQLITGNRGGYVVIHSSTGANEPDEILIMDTPSIETAVKVWRWNNSGLGYSENGYPGPYVSAWTIDGVFNADFITAGTLSANLIKSGLLQSLNAVTSIDMDGGEIVVKFAEGGALRINENGLSVYDNSTGEETALGGIYISRLLLPATGEEFLSSTVSSHVGSFNTLNVSGKAYFEDNINTDQYIFSKKVSLSTNSTDDGNVVVYNRDDKVVAEVTNNDSNLGGLFIARNAEEEVRATLWVGSNDSGRLTLKNSNNQIVAELVNKSGAGGQLELRNENGDATFSFSNASGGGAECWIGEGNGVYKIFDYNDGINLHANHLHLYGKSSGLVTSRLKASECSAYIVYGRPTSGGYVSSIIIPSSIATNYTWQLADELNYLVFSMDSNGNASKNTSKSSSNSGSIIGVYSIR